VVRNLCRSLILLISDFYILRELIFVTVKAWFVLLVINFCNFREVAFNWNCNIWLYQTTFNRPVKQHEEIEIDVKRGEQCTNLLQLTSCRPIFGWLLRRLRISTRKLCYHLMHIPRVLFLQIETEVLNKWHQDSSCDVCMYNLATEWSKLPGTRAGRERTGTACLAASSYPLARTARWENCTSSKFCCFGNLCRESISGIESRFFTVNRYLIHWLEA